MPLVRSGDESRLDPDCCVRAEAAAPWRDLLGPVVRGLCARSVRSSIGLADGELTFVFPNRQVVAGPGTFVFVPRGVEHTAHVTEALCGLIIYSPGDAEHMPQPVDAP